MRKQRITVHHAICGGQAVIRGTRVPVHVILDFLAAEESVESILREYPQISREDVRAALEYAARLARREADKVQPRA